MDYKNDHPERKENEVFLGNITTQNFNKLVGYKTKRQGEIPYTVTGEVVPFYEKYSFYPVFIKREEYEKHLK